MPLPKITQTITFDKQSLKEALCTLYNIDPNSARIEVTGFNGDQRDPSYTEVKLECTVNAPIAKPPVGVSFRETGR